MRTSESHPLRIDSVFIDHGFGRIGITLCPGKKDPFGHSGPWDRDLDLDLDYVKEWGATAVVTLLEEHELSLAIDLLTVGAPPASADHIP